MRTDKIVIITANDIHREIKHRPFEQWDHGDITGDYSKIETATAVIMFDEALGLVKVIKNKYGPITSYKKLNFIQRFVKVLFKLY